MFLTFSEDTTKNETPDELLKFTYKEGKINGQKIYKHINDEINTFKTCVKLNITHYIAHDS